jgi:hypothetical protein
LITLLVVGAFVLLGVLLFYSRSQSFAPAPSSSVSSPAIEPLPGESTLPPEIPQPPAEPGYDPQTTYTPGAPGGFVPGQTRGQNYQVQRNYPPPAPPLGPTDRNRYQHTYREPENRQH